MHWVVRYTLDLELHLHLTMDKVYDSRQLQSVQRFILCQDLQSLRDSDLGEILGAWPKIQLDSAL